MPNPTRDNPDSKEIVLKIEGVKNLLAVLAIKAIEKSQMKIPIKIAALNSKRWSKSYLVEALANTDPKIPSQKRIVSGFEIDIKKPEKNDFKRDSLFLLSSAIIFPALIMLSMPV